MKHAIFSVGYVSPAMKSTLADAEKHADSDGIDFLNGERRRRYYNDFSGWMI